MAKGTRWKYTMPNGESSVVYAETFDEVTKKLRNVLGDIYGIKVQKVSGKRAR